MKNSEFVVAGYGELVFDHVFVKDILGWIRYEKSRGGGSLWNILADLSSLGIHTIAVGVGGDNAFGQLARSELDQLGVDVSRLHLVSSKWTRIIFELLAETAEPSTLPRHTFSARCLVCRETIPQQQLVRITGVLNHPEMDWASINILCMDRLTKNRMAVVDEAHAHGVTTVLDLGRIGYLRYVPAVQTIGYISMFDVVLMPWAVAKSLRRRARLKAISNLLDIGLMSILCVTCGELGMTIYVKDSDGKLRTIKILGQIPPVRLDSAGAGDCFLSRFISGLLQHRVLKQPMEGSTVLVEAVNEAGREAIKAVEGVLKTYSARGHLPFPRTDVAAYELASFRRKSLNFLQNRLKTLDRCPFCGLTRGLGKKTIGHRRSKPIGSRGNVAQLLRRMFFSTERDEAVKQCQQLLQSPKKTAYIVGTGGSFSAATFIALLMSKECRIFAQPIRPYDYIRTAATSDCLIVVSHSGSTKDCAAAIEHAKYLGVSRIALVTRVPHAKLAELLRREDSVIAYGRQGPERGFVSIAGTVCPCALWTTAVVGAKSMVKLAQLVEKKVNGSEDAISALTATLQSCGILNVFGSGLAWPAMIDVESKFVEGGLGTAHLHESKDFSHGRFIRVFDEARSGDAKLLIRVGRKSSYEDTLAKTLGKIGPLIPVISENDGVLGALEVLIEVQFIIQKLGEALGIDISRPKKIPAEGLRLYRWKQQLSP